MELGREGREGRRMEEVRSREKHCLLLRNNMMTRVVKTKQNI